MQALKDVFAVLQACMGLRAYRFNMNGNGKKSVDKSHRVW